MMDNTAIWPLTNACVRAQSKKKKYTIHVVSEIRLTQTPLVHIKTSSTNAEVERNPPLPPPHPSPGVDFQFLTRLRLQFSIVIALGLPVSGVLGEGDK